MAEGNVILAAAEIAVFLSFFIMAFVVDRIEKKKKMHVHGLNIMAVSFLLVAVAEFIHINAIINIGFMPWFMEFENLHLITYPLLTIAGLGIIWYLWGIEKNIEDYY